MPPPEPRQIKRPRISLSCIVCRRRKVRCGREQPECANCLRMKESCVYKTINRDGFTGQAHQGSPAPQNRDSNGAGPHRNHSKNRQIELTWSHWGSQETDSATDPSDEPPPPPPAAAAAAPRPRPAPTRREASSLSYPNTLSANRSRARSPNHRQADLAYPTVPSWQEAIQPPDDHEAPAREGRSSTSVVASASTSTLASTPDYLSLRQGARVRYIGQTFWGFVAGKENLSDDFFDENHDAHPGLPPSHISSIGIFNLLRSLPTKSVSDTLLEAFFFAVWPLSPLVHCPTLRADYEDFWAWCRNSETALPSEKLRDDPTFICLLFAVLYCGASAAPAASWMCASLQGLQKETTAHHLKTAYTTSLSLCQHLEHPTLNTLISTLLTGPFVDRPWEPMGKLFSVSTTVRIAQSMGLHREGTWWSALSPVDREIRRRAWWHIVWLDVQSSISTGLPPCCGSDALDAVGMISDTLDEDVGNNPPACPSPSPDPVPSKHSIAIMFAIGRAESARLQSKIVARLQSELHLTKNGLGELVTGGKELQQKIETLIARIPLQGIPKRGFIPSRLANACPSTHPSLYTDDPTQPTVCAAWARIMLTLLKSDVAILLQKPFLPPPDSSSPQSCKAWTSMAQLCVSYLRIILQLYQAPAFSPYLWFRRSYDGPLQCVFLTLMYLHCFKDSGVILLARYCVDEIIEHSVSHYQAPHTSSARVSPDCSESDGGPSKARLPLAIQVLVDLHSRLDSHSISSDEIECRIRPTAPRLAMVEAAESSSPSSSSTAHTHRHRATPSGPSSTSTTTASPPMASAGKLGPPGSVSVTESDSGLDLDLRASISDLESWSSSLILESTNDILAHPEMMASDSSVLTGLGPSDSARVFE